MLVGNLVFRNVFGELFRGAYKTTRKGVKQYVWVFEER